MGRNATRKVNGNNDRVRNSREPRTKEKWTCKSCKVNKDGKQVPFTNFGHRTECFSCGLSKGVCFGGKCSSDNPSRSVNGAGGRLSARTGDGKRGDETPPAFAEKQLRKELEQRKKELSVYKADAKLAKAQAEKAAPVGTTGKEQADDDASMEDTPPAHGDAAQALREQLKALKSSPEVLHSLWPGGLEGQLEALQAELAAVDEANRNAMPLETQMRQKQGWKNRAVKRADTARKALEAKEEQLTELMEQVEEHRRELAAHEAAIASATEQIAALADRRAAELKDDKPLGPAVETSPAASDTLQQIVAKEVAAAVAAARTEWEQDANNRWQQGEAALQLAHQAEVEKLVAEALMQFETVLGEADADDDASVADAAELEPSARRQREAEKRAKNSARRRDAGRKCTDAVHKANSKFKK